MSSRVTLPKADKNKKSSSKIKKLDVQLAINIRDALKAKILGPHGEYYLTPSSS